MTTPYGLVSMKRTLSYSNGWTAEMVYCLPQTAVDAHIAANYLMSYPGVAQLTVSQIADDPWMADDVVSSTGMSTTRRLVYTFALNYLNVAWPSSITRPSYTAGTTLKMDAKFSGQILMIPARGLKADGASSSGASSTPAVPRNINNRVLIPLIDYHVEWDRVQTLTALDFTPYVGRVNSLSFLGCEPETLLLEGVNITPSFTLNPTSPHAWKATATFKRRKIAVAGSTSSSGIGTGGNVYGWNHDYLPIPPGWTRITMNNGDDRYPKVDFTSIFF